MSKGYKVATSSAPDPYTVVDKSLYIKIRNLVTGHTFNNFITQAERERIAEYFFPHLTSE